MASMNPELVKKFFEGKCTPEEVHQVLLWINSNEGELDLEKEFEEFDSKEELNLSTSQDILTKIHQRISDADATHQPETSNVRSLRDPVKPKNRLFKQWKLGVAVSFLLTIMASAIWLFSGRRQDDPQRPSNSSHAEYVTRETKSGEKLTLKLNDGSTIHINSNSKVRFPKAFTGSVREVHVEGQAFFDVQRDENRPFIVYSRGLITSVLGTSFVIMEDSATQQSQVAVLTGKVKVAMAEEPGAEESGALYLDPMDAASFSVTGGTLEKIRVDYDDVFAWKDNVIAFQDATFDDVRKRLERWFGVEFQVKKKIKPIKEFTGKFNDQTLEEILIGLSFTYDFDFTINDSIVVIH